MLAWQPNYCLEVFVRIAPQPLNVPTYAENYHEFWKGICVARVSILPLSLQFDKLSLLSIFLKILIYFWLTIIFLLYSHCNYAYL